MPSIRRECSLTECLQRKIQIFCSAFSISVRYICQAADDNSTLVRWNERVLIMHWYADFIDEANEW